MKFSFLWFINYFIGFCTKHVFCAQRVVYVIGYINQDSYLWIFPPVKAMKTVLLPARPVSMALMVDFLKEYHNPAGKKTTLEQKSF